VPLENMIWDRISQDDKNAYAEAYRFLFNRFYNYGVRFTTDELLIEDAIQETLLLLWDKRGSLSEIKYPSTYFYSVFRNNLINRLRLKKTERFGEELEILDFSVEEFIFEKETEILLKGKLKNAIEGLTSRQREAIYLRFYEGLSYEGVASILGISTKATYKIMARALSQLRDLIGILVLAFWYFLSK